MSGASVTRVAPSTVDGLSSERLKRFARKWPWAWWCTACTGVNGAAKTEPEAAAKATTHEKAVHAATGGG